MTTRRRRYLHNNLVVIILLALVGCSSKAIIPAVATSTPQDPSPQPTARLETPTVLPPTEPSPTQTPLVMTYRSILLLERAADLIIAYLGDVQAGSVLGDDQAARQQFTLAFPFAIKTYNQTMPPPELNMAWKNVSSIAVEYNKVYSLIQQGKPVSTIDYYNLKAFRQILSSKQGRVEASLSNTGMGLDYFSAEKQSMDRLLQQEYGNIPVPTVSP